MTFILVNCAFESWFEFIRLLLEHKVLYHLLQKLLLYLFHKWHNLLRIKINLLFIEKISSVLEKLSRYLNGTANSTSLVPSLLVLLVNLDMNLDNLELFISSSSCSHLAIDFQVLFSRCFNHYCYILLNYTLALQHKDYLPVFYLFDLKRWYMERSL